uniref:Uncharacterized protein n=1 Tax=Anguilla anguilla TaxID=7936 RepID=A0A0E9RGK3_ANGAN
MNVMQYFQGFWVILLLVDYLLVRVSELLVFEHVAKIMWFTIRTQKNLVWVQRAKEYRVSLRETHTEKGYEYPVRMGPQASIFHTVLCL